MDDEANTLASLSRAFRLAGHEATVCDNAAKALELAKAQNFALDSFRRRHARKRRAGAAGRIEGARRRQRPVVMMSGQADIEMAVRATRLGALDFLEKPISTEKLLLTVENALKTAASRKRKPSTQAAPRQTRNCVAGRGDAARDRATRACGCQRNAHLHSRGDGHRKRTSGPHHP